MAKAVWLKQGSEKYYPAPYWPIGSIYISVVNTNPSQWFGGVWESFGAGRVLVGVDTTQTEFNKVMKTGGEKTHKLTVNEMPSHTHNWFAAIDGGNDAGRQIDRFMLNGWGDARWWGNLYKMDNTGGNQPHNNLQPYITVYMWRRVS